MLIWPLAAVLVALIALAGALLWHQQEQRLDERIAHHIDDITGFFYNTQAQQMTVMSALLDVITADTHLIEALQARDRARLQDLSAETFERLRRGYGIEFFYFLDADRYTVLRMQAPDWMDDRIDRWSVHEAQRTGRKTGGIEIGYFGVPMLRVIKPIHADGEIIGFVELSQKVERLLKWLHRDETVEIAFSIHKHLLRQEAWEDGMRRAGLEADWHRFPGDVVAYSSLRPLPDGLLGAHLAEHDPHDHDRYFHSKAVGRQWRTAYTPMQDASGREIGDLGVMLDVSDLQQSFRSTVSYAGSLAIGVLVVLMAMLYLLLKRTDERIVTQQRAVNNARLLRELSAHHEKVREAERTRIAREVHDQLGQYLTGLRMEAGLLKRELGACGARSEAPIAAMIDHIDTALGVVRDITTTLRPTVLDMGLVPAVEWLLSAAMARSGIDYRLDAVKLENCPLSDEQTTALFRILQEGLTNVLRHARASRVVVRIKSRPDVVVMHIEDDGVGFVAAQAEGAHSFGLMGMAERAQMLGGTLRIDSRPGEGTTVSVHVPCGCAVPARPGDERATGQERLHGGGAES